MKKQQGLTLIEIMISLALGLFIIAATLSVYINTIKMSGNTIKSVRLNHDLGMAMTLIGNDIKRAGSWGGAVIDSKFMMDNPFMGSTTNLNIYTVTTTGDCIVYTYDANGSGLATLDVLTNDVDATEYYGFRRTVTNGVGVIEMRLSGTTTANCTDGTWQAITDGNMINVTYAQFSFLPMAAAAATATVPSYPALSGTSSCLNTTLNNTVTLGLTCTGLASGQYIAQKRLVNIRIAGQVIGADNAEVIKGLSNTVKVRNNRVFKQP